MKIGVIGTGNIGSTIAQRLGAAGHEVKVANSRGPESISGDILSTGARAVTTKDAVQDVEVVILSIPFSAVPEVAKLFAEVPAGTVVIDTSNYYPERDGQIAAVEGDQAESAWVAEQIGRPVTKAWNAILAETFAERPMPANDAQRIAIPVAADDDRTQQIAMKLVEDTGLDAVYSGSIKDSWRQQPGSPVYCTSLTESEIKPALSAAEREQLATRRDLVIEVITKRFAESRTGPDSDFMTRLNRVICG